MSALSVTVAWFRKALNRSLGIDVHAIDHPAVDPQDGSLASLRVYVGLSGCATGLSSSPHMLGLRAAQAFQPGDFVTLYGGVQRWEGDLKQQALSTHSHALRLPSSGFVLDGRPLALLFSRVPELLRDDSLCRVQSSVMPLVTPAIALNLLFLLEHEANNKSGCNGKHTFSLEQSVCKGDCDVCKAAVDERAQQYSEAPSDPKTWPTESRLNALFMRCEHCQSNIGWLPCVLANQLTDDVKVELDRLCTILKHMALSEGIGYMANNDAKNYNLRKSTKHGSGVSLAEVSYIATKPIRAGAELFVSYNNNESKSWNQIQ